MSNKLKQSLVLLIVSIIIIITIFCLYYKHNNTCYSHIKYDYKYRIDIYQPNDTFVYYYTNNVNFYKQDSL